MRRVLALLLLAIACTSGAAEPWERFFSPSFGDLKAEAVEAKKTGKQGLLVMYQFQECPYCARMKREVLARPDVQAAYGGRFRAIEIDTRGGLEVSGFDGQSMAEKDFARARGIRGTPTFEFYSLDGRLIATQVGGVLDPAAFIRLGENIHRQLPGKGG